MNSPSDENNKSPQPFASFRAGVSFPVPALAARTPTRAPDTPCHAPAARAHAHLLPSSASPRNTASPRVRLDRRAPDPRSQHPIQATKESTRRRLRQFDMTADAKTAKEVNLYDALGLTKSATSTEVRRAYRSKISKVRRPSIATRSSARSPVPSRGIEIRSSVARSRDSFRFARDASARAD